MRGSRWRPEDRALAWFMIGGVAGGVLLGTLVGAVVGRVGLFAPIGISVGVGLGVAGWYLWRDLRRR